MTSVRYVSLAEASGYGLSAQGYLRALLAGGVRVHWVPLVLTSSGYRDWRQVDGASDWLEALSTQHADCGYYGANVLAAMHHETDCEVVLIHAVPELWPRFVDSSRRCLGYTVWETDSLPPHWPELINQVHEVLVPCRFNVEVFAASGVARPVHVIPHMLAPSPPAPEKEQIDAFARAYGVPDDHFVFYSIDEWNSRKAPWKLIHAYQQAFSGTGDVSLVIKTSQYGPASSSDPRMHPTRPLVGEMLSKFERPAKVIVIDEKLPAAQIDLLHKRGDCFVSLTHSEGWGLGAFHAAAEGNPVIITGWGGQLDFLGPHWPFLVDYELVPVMNAQGWRSYRPTQKWASAKFEHATALMREVYANPETARRRCEPHSARIRHEYSEAAVGRRLIDVLENVT